MGVGAVSETYLVVVSRLDVGLLVVDIRRLLSNEEEEHWLLLYRLRVDVLDAV